VRTQVGVGFIIGQTLLWWSMDRIQPKTHCRWSSVRFVWVSIVLANVDVRVCACVCVFVCISPGYTQYLDICDGRYVST